MPKKIVIYGKAPQSIFRSQELIKYLLTEYGSDNSFVNPQFFVSSSNPKESFSKSSSFLDKIFLIISAIELVVKALFADYILLLPSNNNLINFAIWASRLSGAQLIVDSYISGYDSLVRDRKLVTEDSKAAKTAKRKDTLALTQSDYFIHLAWCELNYWERIFEVKLNPEKVHIAPLFVPRKYFPVPPTAYQPGEVLKICWWGTFIPLHGLDNILDALQIVQSKGTSFNCVLCGVQNEFFEQYQQKIVEMGLEKCVTLRADLRFSDGSLPEFLTHNCDLALGIFGDTEKAYNAVPNKLVEALTIGIPTLTMDTPAIQEFFDTDVDLWTSSGKPEDIASKIIDIADHKAPAIDWQRTRDKVLETFNFSQYKAALDQIMEAADPTP